MLCLDHVNCSVVSEQLYLCAIWLKSTLYKHFHAMTISILLSFYYVMPHIVMPFLTFCVRSVCAFMYVCLCTHMIQGGITFMLVIRSSFEGIMLVENEPPVAKAGYGPDCVCNIAK